MNELSIDTLEWLLVVAIEEKERIREVINSMKSIFRNSQEDLKKSEYFIERERQMICAEAALMYLSMQITQRKKDDYQERVEALEVLKERAEVDYNVDPPTLDFFKAHAHERDYGADQY